MSEQQESTTKAIIVRQLEAMPVGQRTSDGYINATAMCQIVGKLWGDYIRLQQTQEFLIELAGSMGIPIDLLTHSVVRGPNHERGTWVHPQVAVNLAQWCSPRFAVQVAQVLLDAETVAMIWELVDSQEARNGARGETEP